MNSKGTGITLGLGLLVAFIGYILWQITIGFNTASDDIATILSNSASGSAMLQIATILIAVGLVTHLGGLVAGYLYLRHLRTIPAPRFGFGRLGIIADIKYRYVKWKIGRLRKKFDVYPGGNDRDWDKRIH